MIDLAAIRRRYAGVTPRDELGETDEGEHIARVVTAIVTGMATPATERAARATGDTGGVWARSAGRKPGSGNPVASTE